jgi:hypothetical protein
VAISANQVSAWAAAIRRAFIKSKIAYAPVEGGVQGIRFAGLGVAGDIVYFVVDTARLPANTDPQKLLGREAGEAVYSALRSTVWVTRTDRVWAFQALRARIEARDPTLLGGDFDDFEHLARMYRWLGGAHPVYVVPLELKRPGWPALVDFPSTLPDTLGPGEYRVPVGVDRYARQTWASLYNTHAIAAGASGGGKSSLLRSWVCALIQQYGPGELRYCCSIRPKPSCFRGAAAPALPRRRRRRPGQGRLGRSGKWSGAARCFAPCAWTIFKRTTRSPLRASGCHSWSW